MSEDEPKIIVDDDWKEQVAREKAAASVADDATSHLEPAKDEGENAPVSESDSSVNEDLPPPPPASFEVLITMLFSQAMSMLGQIPDPATGEAKVNKAYAKHYIDTLDMLGEKTEGNLSDEEKKIHGEALHALRMAFVSVKG